MKCARIYPEHSYLLNALKRNFSEIVKNSKYKIVLLVNLDFFSNRITLMNQVQIKKKIDT